MLPSELMRAKVSRGRISPIYADLDVDTLALAERIAGMFREATGRKKGELLERLKEVEDEGYDFKLVRGLSTLLERRCTFEVQSALNPRDARMAVFEEANRARATSPEERDRVIRTVSKRLGVPSEALEGALFSDVEEELIMKDFAPIDSDVLLKRYNFSLMQTLLFKSLRLEFSASGNWKNIFRDVKWLGLIYSVEVDGDGGQGSYKVTLDGPLSLFKMTERYGTSIAKLLPQIVASGRWHLKAEILVRSRGGRVYTFEADADELKGIVDASREAPAAGSQLGVYDSYVEERFARSFVSYGTGWTLRREPEPLIAGTHVLIPDFVFEKGGTKVYLEIVGFWTSDYLERKVGKLASISGSGTDLMIAADESLACSKLERLKGGTPIIYYRREVPLKPIIEHLKERETSVVREQAERLKGEALSLKGDVVGLEEISRERGIPLESLKMALHGFEPEGYVRVGESFISKEKLGEIARKLEGIQRLTDALGVIEASGVKDGEKVLDALGYASVWEGMEMDKAKIRRKDGLSPRTERA